MASCRHCGTDIPPRRRVCDGCKGGARKPDAETPPADESTPLNTPKGLHPRGRELWISLGQKEGTPAGELALEACRSVDRLNELDNVIAGKGVLQLMKFRLDGHGWWDDEGDHHVHVTVGFQSVLTEARLQQTTLKDLLKELRAAIAAQTAGKPATPAPAAAAGPASPAVSAVDQLATRRAAREQATTGH
ncbi:hypothetical protein GCM10028801_41130 [Nocardioides maradonensis]